MPSDANIHGFLLLAPVFIVSLTLHELAHALAAYRLGDRTAKDQGRLTLNPIAHMDPLGSLILVVTYFGGSFLFGWAKPVPVEPANLRTSPQVGMALVGAAGPATNFVLALISGGILAHNDLTGDTLPDRRVLARDQRHPRRLQPLPDTAARRLARDRRLHAARRLRPVDGARPVRHVRRLRPLLPVPEGDVAHPRERLRACRSRDLGRSSAGIR